MHTRRVWIASYELVHQGRSNAGVDSVDSQIKLSYVGGMQTSMHGIKDTKNVTTISTGAVKGVLSKRGFQETV